eukprot:jgi/Antlo1/2305/7
MEINAVDVYRFYVERIVSMLKCRPFAYQIEILNDLRVVPLIFDFCGLTRKLNYFGDVWIVYDYKKCHLELSEIVESDDVAIFLVDRLLNTDCFDCIGNCRCVLCAGTHTNVLVHYL